MLWLEAEIARERVNGRLSTEATLMHAVIVAVLAPGGKGNGNLKKMLKDVLNGR